MLPSTLLAFLTLLTPLVRSSPLSVSPRSEVAAPPIDIPFLTVRNNGDDADPKATLYPSDPWNHDRTNLENLRPTDNHKLYYTDTGEVDLTVKHLFATLDTTYRYPAVALSHSSYVETLECIGTSENRGIKLKLTDPKAYQFLQEAWVGPFEMPKRSLEHELDLESRNNGNTDPTKMFVLVTHTLGCSAASKSGQNTFWLVKSVWFEDPNCLEVTICVEEIAIEHCVDEVEIIWGTHEPIKNDPSNTGVPGDNGGCKDCGGHNPGDNGNNPGNNGGNPGNNGGNPGGNNGGNPGNNGGNPGDNGGNSGGNTLDADCGNIPGDTYLGFPTAPCGETFDIQLDNKIGFYDDNDASLATFAPGVELDPFGDYVDDDTSIPDDTIIATRRALLRKRWGFFKKLKKFVSKVATAVVKVVAPVVNEIKTVANTIKTTAVKVGQFIKKVYDTLQNLGGDYGPKTYSFFEGPARKDPSPWGNQTLIFHKGGSSSDENSNSSYSIAAYCVDCGIGARANVFGTARFALFPVPIVKNVYVQVNGSFLAQLNIGVDVLASYTWQESFNLFRFPIPGTSFAIPGVFIFGGQASLDIAAYAAARAQGQFLIGASASIPNFNARLDLNPAKTGFSGFKPIFKSRREASGSIDIDLGLGLPLEVGFGLSLPAVPSFGSKVLGIRNSPFLVANAHGSFNTNSSFQAGPRCDIPYSLNFVNKIDADLFGSIKPLYKFEKNGLAKGCINFDSGTRKRSEYRTIEARQYDTSEIDTSDSTDPVTGSIASYLDDDFALVAQTNAELLTVYQQVVAANGSAPVDADGFKYTTIQDDSDTYSILGDEMGVLRFANTEEAKSLPWASFEGLVESDAQDRILHYYPAQMDAFGVSRFRIANTTAIPKSAALVTLFPVDDDSKPNTAPIYVPINTQAKPFFPVMCNFVGQELPKFFLSKTEDFSALLRKDLRFILTGGVVEKCGIVALNSIEGTAY